MLIDTPMQSILQTITIRNKFACRLMTDACHYWSYAVTFHFRLFAKRKWFIKMSLTKRQPLIQGPGDWIGWKLEVFAQARQFQEIGCFGFF